MTGLATYVAHEAPGRGLASRLDVTVLTLKAQSTSVGRTETRTAWPKRLMP